MFRVIGTGTKDVNIGTGDYNVDGPHTVRFYYEGVDVAEIDVASFQLLRRAVAAEVEGFNKLHLIKAVRGLTKLGLRDAKNIVEWFEANYDINAGKAR